MVIKIETCELCSYGCGQIAKFRFKNGKLCCSKTFNGCLAIRNKIKENKKLIPIKTNELCSYGCGQIAKYKLKSGKLCCSEYQMQCPISRNKIKKTLKGTQRSVPTPIVTTELCSYGCGQIAKFKLKNGKLCCSKHWHNCPVLCKKRGENLKGKTMPKSIQIITTELCSYGCGQVAKYKLSNGKLCCKSHWGSCSINCKKNRNGQIEKLKPKLIETIELCSYGCGRIAKYKLKNGKLCCNKHYSKCPINRKKINNNQLTTQIITTELCSYGCRQVANYKLKNGKLCCNDRWQKCPSFKITIDQIKEKYPTFSKVEELRYNPNKLNAKEIQVRCKYNKCKNSKENNGWFTPTRGQLYQRIEAIEKPKDYGESNFYCSYECKEKCFLFNLHSDPLQENTESPHTPVELNIFNQEVLRRQKDRDGYNSCEMCESKENLQVHHEKPQKTHPGMTLDPDNGIILCKNCHYKYGHKTGTPCSTGNLANINPCN